MQKATHAGSRRASTILVRPAPGQRSRALVQIGGLVIPAAIGRSGRRAVKHEGDGATPIAAMATLYGFARGDRIGFIQTPLSIRHIRKDMLWCDQPDDANYNRLATMPFRPSHERMMREDGLYDICLVLDWNISSRRRNRGSAIFLHLIKPGYEPTAGCIAVSLANMRRLLPHMRRGTTVRVL